MADAPLAELAALILAGSRGGHDPVAVDAGTSCKAFAPVGGEPMVERVVETLRAVPRLARLRIAIADGLPFGAEAPRLAAWIATGAIERVDPAGSPSRTVLAAVEALSPGESLLVTTADHPLLTPVMVEHFLDEARASRADVAVALARLEAVQGAYPGTRRTRLMFRDGGYSGCNLFLFAGPGAAAVPRFWQRMEAYRKQPWRMAWIIGPRTILALLLRRLTFAQVVARLEQKMGATLHPVILPMADAAIDVDTPEDRVAVEAILRRRRH